MGQLSPYHTHQVRSWQLSLPLLLLPRQLVIPRTLTDAAERQKSIATELTVMHNNGVCEVVKLGRTHLTRGLRQLLDSHVAFALSITGCVYGFWPASCQYLHVELCRDKPDSWGGQ